MISVKELEKILQKSEVETRESLEMETKVFLDLNIDSLTIMEVMCKIEEEYNVRFSEKDLDFNEEFTIGEFIEMINKKMS